MTRNGLKRLWKCLQHCCKRQKVFFEALAALLQTPKSFSGHLQRSCKLQKVFRSTCSIPANAEKFFEALAAFLQTPKSFSRHLQRFCKLQKVFRGTCSVPANSKKFFDAFAALLQTPKSFSRHLQHCCKHFQKHFGRYSAQSKTCSRDKIRDLILTPNSRLLSSDQPRFPHKEQEQIAEY